MTAVRVTTRAGGSSGGVRSTDGGFTLIEMLVSIFVLGVFMTLLSSGIIHMLTSTEKVQQVDNAVGSLDVAFHAFDKTVRYASDINTPGQVNGSWYVEYETTNTGNPVCTQWKLNPSTGILQKRQWSVPTSGSVTAPGWINVAYGLYPPSGSPPFVVTDPSQSGLLNETLQLDLVASSGPPNQTVSGKDATNVTFVAQNTSSTSTTATGGSVCGQVSRS